MPSSQSLEGSPVHPLGFQASAVEDAGFPAQFFSHPIRPSYGPILGGVPLAEIRQLITVATCEDATAIDDRHTPPTPIRWTEEPGS